MQIWTNVANLDKLMLEYEFIDNKLYSIESLPNEEPDARIEQNEKEDYFEVYLGKRKIKLDYYEAHQMFLLLLADISSDQLFNLKVKLIEAKTIKEI
jgi:hypothetical protein